MNKQEAKEFLVDLVNKIKVSNEKEFDARPILFFIRSKVKVSAGDDFSDGSWFACSKDPELIFETEEEVAQFLESDENDSYTHDDFDEVPSQYVEKIEYNAFLTRESCQQHIDAYRYHYQNDTHTFSSMAWRNPLMKGLFEALNTLYGDKDTNKQ